MMPVSVKMTNEVTTSSRGHSGLNIYTIAAPKPFYFFGRSLYGMELF